MIRGDSGDYNLLEKWSKNFDCKGHHTCELGVREGQGSKIIMDNVINNYFHIGVDPYGDIKYKHFDNDEHFHWEHTKDGRPPTYPDSMRDQMIKDFEDYKRRGKYHFVNKTDIDFMYEHLQKNNITVLSKPVLSSEKIAKVFFCLDPDGVRVEIVEMLNFPE